MNSKVEQHIQRSRQRILKMVRPKGEELRTTDPAMVEVKLAEIDAIVALTYAIQDHGQLIGSFHNHQLSLPFPRVVPTATVPEISPYVHERFINVDSRIRRIQSDIDRIAKMLNDLTGGE